MFGKFRLNKGIIFIICGFLIVLASVLVLFFNKSEKVKESEEEGNVCSSSVKNESYNTVSLNVSDKNITFSIPKCIGDLTKNDSFWNAKSKDGKVVINIYHKLVDINNLANADYYDYSLKDEYPNYYLFVKDKKTSKKVGYKVLAATEVKDEKEIQKLYQVMYPLSDTETFEIEFLYKNDVFNEDVFDFFSNSITIKNGQ